MTTTTSFSIVEGATGPALEETLVNQVTGLPWPIPAGSTLQMLWQKSGALTYELLAATIVSEAAGTVKHDWALSGAETDDPGTWLYQWWVTDPAGFLYKFPVIKSQLLIVPQGGTLAV